MVGSMGQVGSAGVNAAMESFLALLQKNVLDRQRWTTATTRSAVRKQGAGTATGCAEKAAAVTRVCALRHR